MNNLKIAYRSLKRNRFYTIINVFGLSIGMAAAILLLVWVYHEWSYDRFHTKGKQLYQVWSRAKFSGPVECWAVTSLLIGPTLKADYPEVVEMTRTSDTGVMLYGEGDQKLNINTVYVDPGFLTMFDFPLLQGDRMSALNDPNSVILTQKVAKRLFGDEDPMGKTIVCAVKYPVKVTGVMKDLPENTQFDFEILGSFEFAEKRLNKWGEPSWGNFSTRTYVELTPQAQASRFNESIVNIVNEHTNNEAHSESFVYPVERLHLYDKFVDGAPSGGRIEIVRMFGIIAVFILLIACINFMNLGTARGAQRAKEVGIRKVLGSRRIKLVGQLLGESALLAVVSGIVALLLVALALPTFSTWMGKPLTLGMMNNAWFWFCWLAFVLTTALLAGSYPAFYLSSFRPVKVLKGLFKGERTLVAPRKVLVVIQFSFAVFLIISTLVVRRQIIYAQNRNAGYNQNQLIYVPLSGDINKNYQLIRSELLNTGVATSMTRTSAPMTMTWSSTWSIEWQGKAPEDRTLFDLYFTDEDWVKTMGTTIVEGRDMDIATFSTDSTALLLNESAVKVMNFENPIGETIRYWGYEGHVVGVIKDFIMRTPFEKTQPMVVGGPGLGWKQTLHIRLNAANKTADNLAKAEQIFKKYNPDYLFNYTFVDQEYARRFQQVKSIESLAACFTFIAILISCLGLFALVTVMSETRRKEIGIRKVLGASVSEIIALLSKEFLVLVMVSMVIAIPVAWWVMEIFLRQYAYRTDIPWWLIAIVGVIILSIALLTVSSRALKAATANPVDAIKAE